MNLITTAEIIKLNQNNYRKLISGQSTGLAAAILRFFLAIAACGYSIIVRLRNRFYDSGLLKSCKAGAPVISIGNITTGGTGKTPLVIWLCKFLQQREIKCAVLTRGYKTTQNSKLKTQNYSDEPAILAESCPNAKVIVNPDRVEAATEAVNEFGAKVLIMDDGFQHRSLHRDIDIVTIDATCPFGYGRILPAGLLRESVTALKRADAAVITRCNQISGEQLTELEEKLLSVNPDMIIAKSIHAPLYAKSTDGEISIDRLKDKKVFAFCGIGNPDAFLKTIKNIEADLVGSKIYNDHYHYTDNDIAEICRKADDLKADLILTTQKDWTKITSLSMPSEGMTFAYLAVELKFISGQDELKQLIEGTLVGRIQGNSR